MASSPKTGWEPTEREAHLVDQQRALANAANLALRGAPRDEIIDAVVTPVGEILQTTSINFHREHNGNLEGADVANEDLWTHGVGLDKPVLIETATGTTAAMRVTGEKQNLGALILTLPAGVHDIADHDVEFIKRMLDLLALAMEREETAELEQRAGFHDVLTGLPNRRLYLERVQLAINRAKRGDAAVAVLFLDLDHFKIVNDTHGHKAGDTVLTAAAERIRESLRPGDTVARFGGDEFTVLCEELRDLHDATLVGERIVRSFDRPFPIANGQVRIGVSVGLCVADGRQLEQSSPESMLRDADVALYQAKERGRSRIVSFDESMRAQEVDRLATESDLRSALRSDSLSLYYQPLVELNHAQVVGTEALVRWNHPQKGPIDPNHFLSIARRSALIEHLDQWVLEAATAQIAQWAAVQSTSSYAASMVMVNVSARQLAAGNLPDMASDAVAKAGIDPRYLCFEIPESVLMHDVAKSMACLTALSERGMCLAVDDFGTGYSSLSYLRRLPVDMLKIDRSFVQGLGHGSEDNAIVAAIINLAHTLGMVAVAEGVETEDQLTALRELQCDLAQGYYFSSARPAAEIQEWDFSFA